VHGLGTQLNGFALHAQQDGGLFFSARANSLGNMIAERKDAKCPLFREEKRV